MNKNELVETVKSMIAAPSCCADLKAAGQKWLDSVGSADEKAAAEALLQELREDVCTIDQVIPFFESERAVQYFGAEQAKAMAARAHELKAAGHKWCFCEACDAGSRLLENADALLA